MNAVNNLQPANAAAAVRLCECIRSFASRSTNPVLELLEPSGHFRENQKLPADFLRFGGNDWRSYYHCHRASHRAAGEHGHFHLFTRIPQSQIEAPGSWTHVISLAMDIEGQPLRWFTVNRWVTDSVWLDTHQLVPLLDGLQTLPEFDLVERWLVAMLETYRDEIVSLLLLRDARVQVLAANRCRLDVLEDRAFNRLAEERIDLLTKLHRVLGREVPPGS